MSNTQRKAAAQTAEMVAFRVGSQEFCVDIRTVREIRGWSPATTLPHAPHYILGVINLRGTVLPVVNLAARLGLPHCEPTPRHVIIVVHADDQTFGLLVDAVSDILSVHADLLQSAPDLAQDSAKAFVSSVVAIGDRMIARVMPERMLPERLRIA